MATLCIGPNSTADNKFTLYDRVSKLLDSFEWSDVTFLIGDKIFKAHKLILAISSPVFQVMFYGPMSEENEIIISDIEPQVFQLLLDFIYKDKVVINTLENACGLLYASKKYMFPYLIDMCIKYIKNCTSITNVMSIYRFSDWIQEDSLIKHSLSLICKHANVVLTKYFHQIPDTLFIKILQEDSINISEKELVNVAWFWSHNECLEKGLKATNYNKRQLLITSKIYSYIRFLILTKDDLQFFKELTLLTSNQISIIEHIAQDQNLSSEKSLLIDNFTLSTIKESRNLVPYEWIYCRRPTIRSTSPLVITNISQNIKLRFKCDKTLFINSFLIPACQSLDTYNKISTLNTYIENIKITCTNSNDSDENTSMTFNKAVEYNTTISIEFPQPFIVKCDEWYSLNISWPGKKSHLLRYPLCFRPPTTCSYETLFTFDDNFDNISSHGSFVEGLTFCI